MKRHTLEAKLKAIQMVESGMSPRQVSKQNAKKSEGLSRRNECPQQEDLARVIEELRQEEHADLIGR